MIENVSKHVCPKRAQTSSFLFCSTYPLHYFISRRCLHIRFWSPRGLHFQPCSPLKMTTLSIFTSCHCRGHPRLGLIQANNGRRVDFSIGLTSARAMCKAERDISTIKELADGSLMFSFGASHSSGNRRRATDLSSSHAEHVASSNIPFPRRMPSNFKKQSPVPVAAVKKEGRHIRNRKQENTGAEKVQDNFDSENVTGETDNVNHSKRGHRLSQRSSTYARKSPMSSPNDGSSPDLNKSSNSSVEDDIVALFRRIQSESTVSKENPGNDKKNSNISSKSMKSADSVLRVLRQYPDKHKEEIEEETNQKVPSVGGYEKMATKIDSSRKQSKKSKEIEEEPNQNISLMGGYEKMATKKDSSRRQSKKSESQRRAKDMDESENFILSRPRSKFVHRSPIPLSAIKKEVRTVPGIQQSDEQNGDTSSDLEGTYPSVFNGSLLKDSAGLSENQPDDLSQLKLSELKNTAKSYGLKGYSKLKKAELLELLRNIVEQS